MAYEEPKTFNQYQKQNYFKTLNDIDVTDFIEWKEYTGKNGKHYKLAFLSWAKAWEQAKLIYPDATYTIYENKVGDLTLNYFHDGRTAYVKCGVLIKGIEHIEYLPVMDKSSKASLPLEQITSFDVNTSIQRCLTKALARHGLGLSVYIGDDLPKGDEVKSWGYKGKYQQRDAEEMKEPYNPPKEKETSYKTSYTREEVADISNDPTDPFFMVKNKNDILRLVDEFPIEKRGTIIQWAEKRFGKMLGDFTSDEFEEAYHIIETRLNELTEGGAK